MNDYYEEDIQKLKKSYFILTLIFASVEIFIIIFTLFKINNKTKFIKTLKIFLIFILINDITIIAIYSIVSLDILKDIIVSALYSLQTYFIMSFINYMSTYPNNIKRKNINEKLILIRNYLFLFILIFPYGNIPSLKDINIPTITFITTDKLFNVVQNLFLLIVIFILYKNINKKFEYTLSVLVKETRTSRRKIFQFIAGIPLSILILFGIFILIKVFIIINKIQIIFFYGNLILSIIEISIKCYIFIIFEIILFELHKINNLKEKQKIKNIFFDEIEVVNT